jgi:hypothetical protein
MVDDSQELQLQIEQLRQTVLALRGSLEQAQLNADQQLQAQIASSEAEKQQLHLIIETLRHGIRLSGPRLGRPKSDPELLAEEKRQFLDDQRQRNAVGGKIGRGKRRFGLGLIREKLAITQGSTIALNVLVMNLEKLLELLFVFFTALLHFLLVNEGGWSIHTVPLKPQIAAA